MARPYENVGLGVGLANDTELVRALQRDLRALGYLRRGIDGRFGPGTADAVRRLQYDLLNNNGTSPVSIMTCNRGVTRITGVTDAALAQSIDALLNNPAIIQVPAAADASSVNVQALRDVAAAGSAVAPLPFMLAMFVQESDCDHYVVPNAAGDEDQYLTIGLDFNDGPPGGPYNMDHITSRGYGLGQFTYFHHPLTPAEASGVFGATSNAQLALAELAGKFANNIIGKNGADDHAVEHAVGSLRVCRYAPGDKRRLLNCRACATEVPKVTLTPATPLFYGSPQTYGQASDYPHASYQNVPQRASFQCDWPYAVRRYNGGGPNSFHYQAIVLQNVLAGKPVLLAVPPNPGS